MPLTSDMVTSYLRSAVPAVWGVLISWLVSHNGWLAGFFDAVGWDPTSTQTGAVVTAAFFFVWYAFWRALENAGKLPKALAALVLGAAKAPVYNAPAGRHAADPAREVVIAKDPLDERGVVQTNLIWTLVGILLVIVLLWYIFTRILA